MKRSRVLRVIRWIAGALAGLVLCLVLLLGTDSGSGFIISRVTAALADSLTIVRSEGSFLNGLRLEQITFQNDDTRTSIESVAIDIQLLPLLTGELAVSSLGVNDVDVSSEPSTTAASDDATWPSISLPIDLRIDSASIRGVSVSSGQTTIDLDSVLLEGALRGSHLSIELLSVSSDVFSFSAQGSSVLTDDYATQLGLDWRWFNAALDRELTGELSIEGDRSEYRLNHGLTAPFNVETIGRIHASDDAIEGELFNRWETIDLQLADTQVSSTGGTLTLIGSPADVEIELQTETAVHDVPPLSIQAAARLAGTAFQLSSATISTDGIELNAAGSGGIGDNPNADMTIVLRGDPATWLEDVVGQVVIRSQVNAEIVADNLRLHGVVDSVTGSLNEQPLSGSGVVVHNNGITALADIRLVVGSNRFDVSGTVGDVFNLQGDLNGDALAELHPNLDGALTGRFAIAGSVARPTFSSQLAGSDLRFNEQAIATVAVDIDIESTGRTSVNIESVDIESNGRTVDRLNVRTNGTLLNHAVEIDVGAYDTAITARSTGRYNNGNWQGELTTVSLAHEAIGQWSNERPTAVSVSDGALSIARTCLIDPTTPGNACFAAEIVEEGVSEVEGRITDLPLVMLRPLLPAGIIPIGSGNAAATVTLEDNALSGEIFADLGGMTLRANYDGDDLATTFSVARMDATLLNNELVGNATIELDDGSGRGQLEATVGDVTSDASSIAGDASVRLDELSAVSALLPDVQNAHGRIIGSMSISGSVARPEFIGEIGLVDGAFGVRQAGVQVEGVNVSLVQRRGGRLDIEGRATSGGGDIELSGFVGLDRTQESLAEVSVRGENFELIRLPDWRLAASPDLQVVYRAETTDISGELAIPNADITVKQLPETAVSVSPDAVVHGDEGPSDSSGRATRVNLRATLGEDVRLAAFGLETRMEGSLQIAGDSNSEITGNGRLSLEDGSYTMYGQSLDIERGELIFGGPLDDPTLNVRATRAIDNVTAGIELSGTPSRLRSNVFSEPALSDAEVLSYLLTGRPLSQAADGGDDAALANAAYAFGLSSAGPITSQIRSSLGLETLTVEGAADNGRIVAGKRIGSRLLVEYGYGLVDKLGTLLLRYQINDRLLLESQTGSVSNLDLIYSVKKK